MKFILDTQLPPQLLWHIRIRGLDAIHTTYFTDGHLLQDTDIRKIAIEENRIIITKDSNFLDFFLIKGFPQKCSYLNLEI